MTNRSKQASICSHCGVEFHAHRGSPGFYCSRSCASSSKIGSKNSHWKGGRVDLGGGRIGVYAPELPEAVLCGGTYILEYRLIAAKKIGRPLFDSEEVHHKDEDPSNNDPDNLVIVTKSRHHAIHSAGMVRDSITGKYLRKGER